LYGLFGIDRVIIFDPNTYLMVRFIIGIPLLIHGLAHISGFLAAYSSADVGFNTRPWIFPGSVCIQKGPGRLFGIIWLLAMGGFITAGLMVLFHQNGWDHFAVAGATLSLISIIPWWRTVPLGARIGVLFDLLILLCLLTPIRDTVLHLVG